MLWRWLMNLAARLDVPGVPQFERRPVYGGKSGENHIIRYVIQQDGWRVERYV